MRQTVNQGWNVEVDGLEEQQKIEAREKTKQLINQMRSKGSLPALNENVQDISRLTRMSKTCAADLAAVIMRDCGLTSNILVTCNSTYYAPRYPIKTVSSAVTFLGFDKIFSLAFGLSIFKQNMSSDYDQELLKLYASSYFAGTLAMSLARESNYKTPEEIFVAGLLYQLPSLALAYTFPDQFKRMENLIQTKKMNINSACKRIFDVEYDDICQGVAEIYKMPGKVEEVLKGKDKADSILGLVQEASNIANMLFGGHPGGKTELAKVENRIKEILNRKKFSVADFIKEACVQDENVKRFFNLSSDDVEMMVNILEWGKANPAQVITKLDVSDALEGEEHTKENMDLVFGQYMNELFTCRRRDPDINQILMLAQEALYRCLNCPDVFTVFIDKRSNMLKGRFYAGNNLLLHAEDFQVSMDFITSPMMKCLEAKKTLIWDTKEGSSLKLAESVISRLRVKHVMMSPIIVDERGIGLYFISRPSNEPFEAKEESWLEQIIENVQIVFERFRSGKG